MTNYRNAGPPVCVILSLLLTLVVLPHLVWAQTPSVPAPPSAASNGAPVSSAAASADPAPVPSPAPLSESLTGLAKAHYDAAVVLFEDGDARGAQLKFRAAHEVSHDPRLLWNMAVCEKQQRHYAKMMQLIDRYLADGGSFLTDMERAEATAVLETLQPFVARLTIEANEAGATAYVDGELVGQTPLGELLVDMGSRKIRVTKEGFKDWKATRQVSGGSRVSVVVKLEAERHVGVLRIVTDINGNIRVDGEPVGRGRWQGELDSGTHGVDVSSPGMELYQADVLVQDDQVTTVRVNLKPLPKGGEAKRKVPPWLWIAGSAVLAAGLGTGGYFLARPHEPDDIPPVAGTMDPGWIQMPLRRSDGHREP